MADLAADPGPQFWEQVRQEFARTEVSSLEVFQRDEVPWILGRFRSWRLPGTGSVTGYRWVSGVIELIEFEAVTWEHPEIDPD